MKQVKLYDERLKANHQTSWVRQEPGSLKTSLSTLMATPMALIQAECHTWAESTMHMNHKIMVFWGREILIWRGHKGQVWAHSLLSLELIGGLLCRQRQNRYLLKIILKVVEHSKLIQCARIIRCIFTQRHLLQLQGSLAKKSKTILKKNNEKRTALTFSCWRSVTKTGVLLTATVPPLTHSGFKDMRKRTLYLDCNTLRPKSYCGKLHT